MGERHHYAIVLPLVIFFLIAGCEATSTGIKQSSFQISNSLPQNKLAYYNESFDKLRLDLWEKSALTFTQSQTTNFKFADMDIEAGALRIETQKGHFSRGALISKYAIKGDLDVQVDCQMNFLQKAHGMDQILIFAVSERQTETKIPTIVIVGLSKREGRRSGIFMNYIENNKRVQGKAIPMESFEGTLRIVRIGKKISTFYKKEKNSDWVTLLTFKGTDRDVGAGFGITNFISTRSSIHSELSIVGKFDNFKINAAQQIIEDEI